jgi:predicted nucleic acid-binding protein
VRRYLLDSAPLAAYINQPTLARALIGPWIAKREVATSIFVYGEVVEYLKSLTDFTLRQFQLRRLLVEVLPLFPTYAIMERYADIRRDLRPPFGPGLIGDMDTLIAATAIEQDLTLVTTDTDFERVRDLKLNLVSAADLRD